MLEILMIFLIARNIASIAKKKNRNPTGYVLLLVFGWIGGEVIGLIAGFAIAAAADLDDGPDMLVALGGALVGILIAVGIAYSVVNAAAPLPKRRRGAEYDDYDDDLPPRRRRRDDDADDEDDDRPRSRRGREIDYDDEDDRPRRRRYADEDDEDDRPRRRRDDDD